MRLYLKLTLLIAALSLAIGGTSALLVSYIMNAAFEEELKAKGVSGRIWGQSQKLSKLKNYTDVQPFEHIPNIKQVEKSAEYKQSIEVGSSQILTYKFDITKTKELKKVLDKHIKTSINGNIELYL